MFPYLEELEAKLNEKICNKYKPMAQCFVFVLIEFKTFYVSGLI